MQLKGQFGNLKAEMTLDKVAKISQSLKESNFRSEEFENFLVTEYKGENAGDAGRALLQTQKPNLVLEGITKFEKEELEKEADSVRRELPKIIADAQLESDLAAIIEAQLSLDQKVYLPVWAKILKTSGSKSLKALINHRFEDTKIEHHPSFLYYDSYLKPFIQKGQFS